MHICSNCHIGKISQQTLPYIKKHGPNAIVVDRLPAQICDTCGAKTYDARALEALQRLLWSDSSQPSPPPLP